MAYAFTQCKRWENTSSKSIYVQIGKVSNTCKSWWYITVKENFKIEVKKFFAEPKLPFVTPTLLTLHQTYASNTNHHGISAQ